LKDGVSIIVCHHQGNLVYDAVNTLLLTDNVEFEIIVATSIIHYPLFKKEPFLNSNVKVIDIPGGPAVKRNKACLRVTSHRMVKFNFIAFFDDDVEVMSDTVYKMYMLMKTIKSGMVFGKTLNFERRHILDGAGSYLTNTGFLWAREEHGNEDTKDYERSLPVLAGKSASCMIRREIFEEVGLFDESYEILGEETDLAWRVWLKGHPVWFCGNSITYHKFNTSLKPNDFYVPERVYFNGCRNYLSMLITNLELKNLLIPLTVQIIVWTTAAIGMIITGKVKAGFLIFKGLGYIYENLGSILIKRHKVQSTREITDKELFKYVRKSPPIKYYIYRLFHYIKTGRHG